MTVDPEIIVGGGTAGLVGFLLAAVWALWRDHASRDEKDRANLDKAIDIGRTTAYALKELAEWAEESGRRQRVGGGR